MSHWPRLVTVSATISTLVLGVVLLAWGIVGSDPLLQHALGMYDAQDTPLPQTISIMLSADNSGFNPQIAAVASGSHVRFTNALNRSVELRTTAISPAQLTISIAAHAQKMVQIEQPGLYQYYDELAARPRQVVEGSTILSARSGSALPAQGWIAVLGSLPGLQEQLTVPADHDLFTPRVQVALVGSTIRVANGDSEAHNLVIDTASPTGAAFIVSGSDTEHPGGWQRALVVQQAGLYHVYCTLHTRVIGIRDGWREVMPQKGASGYADNDPMEAWIIVLPATVAL